MPAARVLAPLGVTLLLAAGVVLLISALTGSDNHMLRAVFEQTQQLAPGQEVRLAGRKVGEVHSIELVDGRSVVELEIREDEAWPLRRGTTAGIRWGSTTSLAYRYVELKDGPKSAPDLPDNGVLTLADTITPVELDESYRIFRGRTKGDLKQLVGELGDTLASRGDDLKKGLGSAPGGLDETSAFLRELGADQQALRTLIVAGDTTTSALASREGDLGGLVDNAAATFDELAQHAGAQQAALERAPRAFDTSTATLRRLDTSLVGLRRLVDDLAPGARELRNLATPARRALAELRRVVPLATATLRTGTGASPSLKRLLATGETFLPQAGDVFQQLEPMISCLRPYAPELAGNLATWTGYNSHFDSAGHYARTVPLTANPLLYPGTRQNSLDITRTLPGRIKYAMPRPPGMNAGKPWFQPQCGAGPDSLDPSKDPEGAGR